jgi:SAM-dependent methyltransferase
MLLYDVPQTIGIAQTTIATVSKRRIDDADAYYIHTLALSHGIRTKLRAGPAAVDPVAQSLVGATSGRLYTYLVGDLAVYPIPELRLPNASGHVFLDIGCTWGRWSIAAARKGYLPIGIDPSLGAVLAALRLDNLRLHAAFVVANARHLPFESRSFDVAFS